MNWGRRIDVRLPTIARSEGHQLVAVSIRLSSCGRCRINNLYCIWIQDSLLQEISLAQMLPPLNDILQGWGKDGSTSRSWQQAPQRRNTEARARRKERRRIQTWSLGSSPPRLDHKARMLRGQEDRHRTWMLSSGARSTPIQDTRHLDQSRLLYMALQVPGPTHLHHQVNMTVEHPGT